MKRIAIIGNAAGGKSTFCKKISKELDIPHYLIDQIQWKPNWVHVGEKILKEKHEEILKKEKWIIDGLGSYELIEERFNKADLIVYVNLKLFTHYLLAIKRQIKSIYKKNEIEGCSYLPMTWILFKMIWKIDKEFKPEIKKMLEKHKDKTKIVEINKTKDYKEVLKQITVGEF